MTSDARMQRDVVTIRLDMDVDIGKLIQDDKPLHINMGISSILGTRKNQQDTVFGNVSGNRAIAVVCDGMGGMNGGEFASQTAATILAKDFFDENPVNDIADFFRREVKKMDTAVYDLLDENGEPLNGGTTVVAVIVDENKMYFLSVGDSKIYVIRENRIMPVNREHNYRLSLDERLRKGEISKEEYMAEEPQAEALISYLGMGNVRLMDINNTPFILKEGDIILLCSDGLYKRLSDNEILRIIQYEEPDMERAAKRLTDLVTKYTKKSQDNTSLVMLQYSRY